MRFPSRIDFLASEVHFADHLIPVWEALPEDLRGDWYLTTPWTRREAIIARLRAHGIQPRRQHPKESHAAVASASGDLSRWTSLYPDVRMGFMEHGCGLTYAKEQASYVGTPHRPNCAVIMLPNEDLVDPQRAATPWAEVVSLGSQPRLDKWKDREHEQGRVAVVSWHWECKVLPETRTALFSYRHKLGMVRGQLLDAGVTLLGHAHPRIAPTVKVIYKQLGIEYVPSFDEVLERADVYAVDNSSTLYEFAATGRPVVAMNCNLYRRDVQQNVRFWSHVPGIQVDGPDDLAAGIVTALDDPPELRALREAAVARVFPNHDGQAARRAAETLARVLL